VPDLSIEFRTGSFLFLARAEHIGIGLGRQMNKQEESEGQIDLSRQSDDGRVTVTIMIDADILARFQALGPDWREKMEEALHAASSSINVAG
jgi:uncharacterized protein (DUF4415 family)